MPVFLGEVELDDWELPETIPMGGQQSTIVHRIIGGRRIVDAMGPDDAVLEWTGFFFGPTAPERALRLDLMRRDGQERIFAYDLRSYRVVISHFSAEFKLYPIPYKIALTIVEDLVADLPPQDLLLLEDQINADLALADEMAAEQTAMLEAVAAAQDAVLLAMEGAAALRGLGNVALTALRASVAGAVVSAASAAAAADSGIMLDSMGGVVAGGDPELMAASYVDQTQAVTDSCNAIATVALLSRVQANVGNVPP